MIIKRITCKKRFAKYGRYKPWVRKTFNCRCAYCTTHEVELGGMKFFTLDHFVPASVAPLLENVYANLVYACDVCNTLKADDWHPSPLNSGRGYLNPCKYDYDDHFKLQEDGTIQCLTLGARYMLERLHLNRSFLVNLRKKRLREQKNLTEYEKLIAQAGRTLKVVEDPQDRKELREANSELNALKSQVYLWLKTRQTCPSKSYWAMHAQQRMDGTLTQAIQQARLEAKRTP